MFREPFPTAEPAVITSALADGPVPFIGVMDAVHPAPGGIVQVDVFTAVVEKTGPITNNVRNAWVTIQETSAIRRHHEVSTSRQSDIRESELNAAGKSPAIEIHRRRAFVVEFEPFVQDVLGRGVIHDLRNHKRERSGVERHRPWKS